MLLHIPGIADDKADVKQLVKRRLSDEGFGQWLMIIDNADDVNVLFDPLCHENDTDRLIDYLPHSRKGSLVFTTRNRKVAIDLAESNVIEVSELNEPEAKELLRKRLLQKDLEDDKVVHEFLEVLTYLPLAIVQAIAFINTNDIPLSEYISEYRSSEEEATDLLSEEFEDQGRYRNMKNPVATTWYMSFNLIRKYDPLAAEYLSFMACTTGENIPGSLLLSSSSGLKRIKAIGTLKAYAFITERQAQREVQQGQTQGQRRAFDVHPLVHLATRNWLRAHDQWHVWANKTLTRLVEVVPFGGHDKREVWMTYLPHAIHVVDLPQLFEAEARMSLLDRIGHCEQMLGHYKGAQQAHQQLLGRREKVLGKEHPGTLISMNNLAIALSNQGKYIEAEKMHQETLALREKVSGKEHPETLTSMNNLALTLKSQGRNQDAISLMQQCFQLRKQILGPQHPYTKTSLKVLNKWQIEI